MTAATDSFRAVVAVRRMLDRRLLFLPSSAYCPSYPGLLCPDGRTLGFEADQRAFHTAPHRIRAIFPGNGWGKTMALGCEVNAWVTHSGRWQRTPPWPVICVWVCQQFKQFDMQARAFLETKCFTRGFTFHGDYDYYEWPGGDRLYIVSADRSWKHIQGVELDLVIEDEEPPLSLHRELRQRSRGARKTRFLVGATATMGETWMEEEFYSPWLEHHKALGLDESGAMKVQSHPDIWCWPRGGIEDNPVADAEDLRWYRQARWSSEKEKKVRLHGGFENWVGDAVFDPDGVEFLRARMAELDAELGAGETCGFEVERRVVNEPVGVERRRPAKPPDNLPP